MKKVLFQNWIEIGELEEDYSSFEAINSNLMGIRFMGAYNSSGNGRLPFDIQLNYEIGTKSAEHSIDLVANGNFKDYYTGELFDAFWLEQLEYRVINNNGLDTLYDSKLGFLYSHTDIRVAFERDVWSSYEGSIIVPDEKYDDWNSNNIFDYYHDVESDTPYDRNCFYHREGFLKIGSKPWAVLIRKPETWNKNRLELVKKEAKKNNLPIYEVEW